MTMESRYVATRAILAALMSGRKLSQMDCQEFMVEDMRSVISHIRRQYEDTHELKTEWIRTPVLNRRIKEYSLVKKTLA